MKKIRPRYLVLILSISMVIGGSMTAWLIQNDFGTVSVTEVDILTDDSVTIHSTLQRPIYATASNPVPGVVVIHGVYQSKEWLRAFGIELARRGFVTLTIDAASHGNSEYASGTDSDRGGAAALEYLDSLAYVSKLGLVGHSMGAGIAIQALELTSVPIDALVFVGGGSRDMGDWGNSTYPKNLLITVGRYDELFNIPNLINSLTSVFNETSSISVGQRYGEFADGSARMLVIGQTNHLFETIDPIIISETIEWLKESLKGSGDDPYWISKGNLIYLFHILGGFISSLGIFLSFFPVLVILIDLPFFQSIKQIPSSSYSVSTRGYWAFGALYAGLSLGSFIPALLLPSIPFPQNLGSTVGVWLLGSAFLALIALFFIHRYQSKHNTDDLSWSDYGIDTCSCAFPNFGKSTILAFLVLLWAYFWMLPLDLFFALDFSAFLPLFNDLPLVPPRMIVAPLYLIFTIPFFVIEGMWLMGLLRTSPKDNWVKTQFSWTSKAIFIKILPYALILIIQLIMSIFLGSPFISGMIGFYLLFFWMFTPFFIITTFITAWTYYLTERVYVGAVLNALIFSWTLASIMTLAM